MSEDKDVSEVERLRSRIENLEAALFYSVTLLDGYDREIRNAEEVVPGLDLVSLGFCQGTVFTRKYDRLSQIFQGARDYAPGFDYAARLESFIMRDVKPDVGLFFAFGTGDGGVMEGGALDFLGVFQTEAEARRRLEHPALFGANGLAAGHVASFKSGSFDVVASGGRGLDGNWQWHSEFVPARAPYLAFGYRVYYPSGGARDLLGMFATEALARDRIVTPREDDVAYDAGHVARIEGGRMNILAGAVLAQGGVWRWTDEGEGQDGD